MFLEEYKHELMWQPLEKNPIESLKNFFKTVVEILLPEEIPGKISGSNFVRIPWKKFQRNPWTGMHSEWIIKGIFS